jgi:hypothetical protein
MGADNPLIENAAGYIQKLQAKYGVALGADGAPNCILDKEHLLSLLVKMDQMNDELRSERDEYHHNLIGMLKEYFAGKPLPPLPPQGELQDMEELMKELEILAHE